jgi:hypothetical protein
VQHQWAQAVLIDPMVELGRLHFNLAMAAVVGENLRLDLVLEGGR